jgi:two-component system chemotaxis response regulator CheY
MDKISSSNKMKTKNMQILVAEDDYVTGQITVEIMSKYGTVHHVKDGMEAIELFKKSLMPNALFKFDLICMDIMMPHLDGLEATRLIRKEEEAANVSLKKEIPIIMTTVLDNPKTIISSFYQSGATAYIIKPVTIEKVEIELKKIKLI